jgi:hypothetical protein
LNPLEDEQIKKANALARNQGHGVPPEPPEDEEEKSEFPPNAAWVELPRVGRQLSAFAREIGNVCATNGIFKAGEDIVTVDTDNLRMAVMDPDKFRGYVEQIAVTFKWEALPTGKGTPPNYQKAPTTMTSDVAKGTLRNPQFIDRQRPLLRVHSLPQPVMREDGRIELLKEGYDQSGIFTTSSGIEIKDIGREASLALLDTLLEHFPFVSPLDKAVQIANMVSFYGAMLLPLNSERLNYAMKANKHRSGKTLLIKVGIVPVTGEVTIQPYPANPKEMTDLLNTTANDGASYLVIDDITGHVKSPSLNAYITASKWGFRGFHTQRSITRNRQAVVFLSGHEMSLQADLEGRFLECRLHIAEADSLAHRVPTPINERWLKRAAQRSDICSALWSLILDWDRKGRPGPDHVKPGFEEWCSVFGGIVKAAGYGDPCMSRPAEERTDDEFSDMVALVEELMLDFKEGERVHEFDFDDLLQACATNNLLHWKIKGRWRAEAGIKVFEADDNTNSRLGRMFSDKFGGTAFDIEGRKIRFSKQGKNRSRKYFLSIESDDGAQETPTVETVG